MIVLDNKNMTEPCFFNADAGEVVYRNFQADGGKVIATNGSLMVEVIKSAADGKFSGKYRATVKVVGSFPSPGIWGLGKDILQGAEKAWAVNSHHYIIEYRWNRPEFTKHGPFAINPPFTR